jgi:hypothetical protein
LRAAGEGESGPIEVEVGDYEIRFHKWLSFTVEALTSSIQITDMATEDIVAQPGDSVYVDFWLANESSAADTVVQTFVLDAMTDQVRAGLL